jgi:hybrid cluster-associated redox disulfide protein
MSLMDRFTKQMSILEALESHPGARDVFARWGMGCSLCIGAQLESIESGAIMHAVDPDTIIAELNGLRVIAAD